jgi:hypothetical protein
LTRDAPAQQSTVAATPPRATNLTAGAKNVTARDENMTAGAKNVTARGENMTARGENVTARRDGA